ncbi:hypothetical protein [Sphingomonas sanguinis]|uniref:hypothetical protein n=1 Tax=Sphingomonas sanguinis TaxID=33051 RepID=UPI00214AD9CB|nr:hypothetical protein [Sphingomonas sanguinis]
MKKYVIAAITTALIATTSAASAAPTNPAAALSLAKSHRAVTRTKDGSKLVGNVLVPALVAAAVVVGIVVVASDKSDSN